MQTCKTYRLTHRISPGLLGLTIVAESLYAALPWTHVSVLELDACCGLMAKPGKKALSLPWCQLFPSPLIWPSK